METDGQQENLTGYFRRKLDFPCKIVYDSQCCKYHYAMDFCLCCIGGWAVDNKNNASCKFL